LCGQNLVTIWPEIDELGAYISPEPDSSNRVSTLAKIESLDAVDRNAVFIVSGTHALCYFEKLTGKFLVL